MGEQRINTFVNKMRNKKAIHVFNEGYYCSRDTKENGIESRICQQHIPFILEGKKRRQNYESNKGHLWGMGKPSLYGNDDYLKVIKIHDICQACDTDR